MSQQTFEDFLETTRFRFVWQMAIAISVILLLVTLMNLTNSDYYYEPDIIAAGMGITSVVYMKFTGNYKYVSMFMGIGSFAIVSLTFLTIYGVVHYTTPMWMIVSVLFVFFTLGKLWGVIMLVGYSIVLSFYFSLFMSDNLQAVEPFDFQDILTFTLEFVFCLATIGYILYLFLKTNNYAQLQLGQINTQLSEQNRVIKKSMAEKDLMMREIHHRVKNNLQVISSLLRLQASMDDEAQHVSKFTDAVTRVNAMALIHENLYQGDNLSNLDLKEYISNLSKNLINNYSLNHSIKFSIESTLDEVNVKTLVPMALLFNELITNSIKHAYEGIEDPTFHIYLSKIDKTNFTLCYSDNGTWKESSKQSFGKQLIESMVEQLEGSMELEHNQEGTRYLFYLKNLEEKNYDK